MDFNTLAGDETVRKTISSLTAKGYQAIVLNTGLEALNRIKKIIPVGSSVYNGASVTLEQIGYEDYLSQGKHKWKDYRTQIKSENDPAKRLQIRRQAALSEYYLGSVTAVTQSGEFIVASNTGSQLPQIVYTAPNLLFIVSTKKIVMNLEIAMKRLEYVVPLEDEDMKKHYNIGTELNKIVIFRGESRSTRRKISFIFVKENLGF